MTHSLSQKSSLWRWPRLTPIENKHCSMAICHAYT